MESSSHPRLSERRAWIALAGGLLTLTAGIVLAIIGLAGSSSSTTTTTLGRPIVPGANESIRLLAGTPQSGLVLGDPRAPVTLVAWADLQCPFCREWSLVTLPALVRDYVRPGKLQIVFRGLAFLGPDSQRALQIALAAALQDRLWQVVDLVYRLQGIENSGWATNELLQDVVRAVPGLDLRRVLADASSEGVHQAIVQTAQAGDAARVTGTPTFHIGKTATKRLQLLRTTNLSEAAFEPAIEQLLH